MSTLATTDDGDVVVGLGAWWCRLCPMVARMMSIQAVINLMRFPCGGWKGPPCKGGRGKHHHSNGGGEKSSTIPKEEAGKGTNGKGKAPPPTSRERGSTHHPLFVVWCFSLLPPAPSKRKLFFKKKKITQFNFMRAALLHLSFGWWCRAPLRFGLSQRKT